jgi:hypothetical protein
MFIQNDYKKKYGNLGQIFLFRKIEIAACPFSALYIIDATNRDESRKSRGMCIKRQATSLSEYKCIRQLCLSKMKP